MTLFTLYAVLRVAFHWVLQYNLSALTEGEVIKSLYLLHIAVCCFNSVI